MISTLISFDRSAVRAISVAVATATLLAACNTDNPVEPTAARIPTTAQPVIMGLGLGSIAWTTTTIEANVKKIVGGAAFNVTGARMSRTVIDNGQNDADPAWGKLKLTGLQPGTFSVCEFVAPVGYVISAPSCRQVAVVANGTVTTEFDHLILPHAQITVRNASNQLVGGATFTIKTNTSTVAIVTDNDAKDLNKMAAYFTVRLPAAGSYWVCPTTAPAGYAFSDMTCRYGFYQNNFYTSAGTFQLVAKP